jgi:hypothetical protein
MKVGPVLILFFFLISIASAQSNHSRSGGSAQGSISVTATVVPSVWLNMDSDGKQEVVVANSSADPKESFSHAAQAQKQNVLPARLKRRSTPPKKTSTGAPQARQGGNESEAVGRFNLPPTQQFEVKQEIIVMDVTQNRKTERQPVKVTTVVPR